MSDDSLMMDGKKYLSSKRSAELLGYSSDYIGELCRQGKVTSFRKGRQWFIEEQSLFAYLERAREKSSERKQELSHHLSRQLGKKASPRPLFNLSRSSLSVVRRLGGFFASRRFMRASVASVLIFAIFFAQTPVARAGLEDFSLSSILRITRSVTDDLAASFQETVAKTTAAVNDLAAFPKDLAASVKTAVGNSGGKGLLAAVSFSDFTSGLRDVFDSAIETVTETLNRPASVGTTSQNGSESASGGGSTSVTPAGTGPAVTTTDGKTITERIIERIVRVETPIIQNITQTSPGTTVTGGVSSSDLELRLQQVSNQLRTEISRVSSMSSVQTSQVFQVLGQATRIDNLSNTVITTPSISGGTWSNANLTDSTTIAALTLGSATTTSSNGFNISSGCYAVNGVCSGSGAVGAGTMGQFAFYNAADSVLTATSSIYLTQSGNIGIGTTSPTSRLGVHGDVTVTGTTTTGALVATGTVTFASGLGATSGGTGQTTFTTGDILYASGANTLSKLAAGSNGQVLKLSGGVPTWAADLLGSGGGGGGIFATTTNDMAFYAVDTTDVFVLGNNATTTTGTILEVTGNTRLIGELRVTGSTTLQNLMVTNVTSTNATTTSSFATTASSTNLFTSNFTLGRVTGFLKATAGAVATSLINLATDVTGILPTANGGTGWGEFQANAILIGNGTGAIATTTAGTNGQVLALVGGVPTWQSTTTLANISGTLGVTKGGTGLTSVTTGDIVYGSGANTLSALAASTNGFVLALSNGIPSWVASTTLSTISGALNLASQVTGTLSTSNGGTGWGAFQANSILIGNGTGAVATTSAGTNGQVLALVGGVPTWQSTTTLANISGTLGVTSGGTGLTAAATGDILYASNTNTLSRLAASTNGFVLAMANGIPSWVASTTLSTISGVLNLASQVTGTLAVSNGGTGAATFGQGWIYSDGGTGALAASTSPTVNYLVSTSTTATSTFAAGIRTTALDVTGATSTFANGIQLTSGCFRLPDGNCAGTGGSSSGGGSGTVDSGTQGQLAYYGANGTTVSGTSQLFLSTGNLFGIGSTSPFAKLAVNPVAGDINQFAVGSSTATSFLIDNAGKVYVPGSDQTADPLLTVGNSSYARSYALSLTNSVALLKSFVSAGANSFLNGTASGDTGFKYSGNLFFGLNSNSMATAILTSAGKFGLGSTTPLAKLSVHALNGETNTSLFNIASSTASATTSLFDISNIGTLSLNFPTNSSSFVVAPTTAVSNQVTISGPSYLRFSTNVIPNSDNAYDLGATGNRWRSLFLMGANVGFASLTPTSGSLVVSGNTGVGTSTPFAKLSVHANNGETNTRLFDIASSTQSATTSIFTILNNGNIGIGTSTPNGLLTVVASTSFATIFASSTPVIDPYNVTRAVTNYESYSLSDSSFTQTSKYIKVSADFITNGGSGTGANASNAFVVDMVAPSTSGDVLAVRTGSFRSTNSTIGKTVTTMIGLNASALTTSAATTTTAIGLFGSAGHSGSGNNFSTTSLAVALHGVISNISTNGLIADARGLNIANISNSGTITSTYGVYVGDITAGTQTNTPYSFYASDTSAYNFFASSTAIGSGLALGNGTPDALLHLYSGNTYGNTIRLGRTASDEYADIDYNRSGATTLTIKNAYGLVGARTNFDIGTATALSLYHTGSRAFVGVGSSTPWARLAVNPIAGDTNQFAVGSSTATSFIIDPAGKVGIGLTAPNRKLDVFEANSVAQLRLSKSASLYSELTVDSTGDLTMSAAGGDIYATTENLWICDGGSCPALTATSTAGNIFVENAVTFGNGFSFRQISVNELGLYNASSSLLMIFDQGN